MSVCVRAKELFLRRLSLAIIYDDVCRIKFIVQHGFVPEFSDKSFLTLFNVILITVAESSAYANAKSPPFKIFARLVHLNHFLNASRREYFE